MPKKIEVLSRGVRLAGVNEQDYLCLTDIARYKDATASDDLIRNWLRNRNTIEFLGIWEHINNPGFNPVEFDGFKKQAGLNSFTLTPKQWIERTGAIGIQSKAGRYGAPMRTATLLSSSPLGSRSSSSSISSRSSSDLRRPSERLLVGTSGATSRRSTTASTPMPSGPT